VGETYKFCKGCGEPPPKQVATKLADSTNRFGAALRKVPVDGAPSATNPEQLQLRKSDGKNQPEVAVSRDSASAMQACGECGKANARGFRFCKSCGAPPTSEQTLRKSDTTKPTSPRGELKASPRGELKTSPRDSGATTQTCTECGKANVKGERQRFPL
jgi:membrane protease subunit (stomatin/prohibitin family)